MEPERVYRTDEGGEASEEASGNGLTQSSRDFRQESQQSDEQLQRELNKVADTYTKKDLINIGAE